MVRVKKQVVHASAEAIWPVDVGMQREWLPGSVTRYLAVMKGSPPGVGSGWRRSLTAARRVRSRLCHIIMPPGCCCCLRGLLAGGRRRGWRELGVDALACMSRRKAVAAATPHLLCRYRAAGGRVRAVRFARERMRNVPSRCVQREIRDGRTRLLEPRFDTPHKCVGKCECATGAPSPCVSARGELFRSHRS